VPRVAAIGLCAPLGATSRGRVSRLGELHVRAGALQLLDDKAPARRRLDGHLDLLADPALQERAQRDTVRRNDPPGRDLARPDVQRVVSDLAAMQVKPGNDRHLGPPR
jgi:hypothetical protein